MPRLIWVLTGRTDHFIGFVLLRLWYIFFFQLAQLLGVKRDHDDVGVQIMAMLIQAGASPDVKNKKGETPVSLCKDSSTREFMQK